MSEKATENGVKESDVSEPFILPSNRPANEKEAEEGGRGCCKGKCTWRKCGIVTGVVSVLIVLILAAGALRWYAKLTGEATSEDSEEWNQRLTEDQDEIVELSKSIVDGEFLLVSFDENYSKFLEAMGTPAFVATLITSAREVITFQEPEEDHGLWKMITKTDLNDKSADFRMGHPFEDTMGRSRKVHLNTTCTLGGEKSNVLTCDAVAKETGLAIKSVAVFSRQGFIDTRTLVNEGMTTKKYYERVSRLELAGGEEAEPSDDDELGRKIKEAAEEAARQDLENPFGSDSAKDEDFDF